MTDKRKLAEKRGRRAESLAVVFLRLKGYRVLEVRYKTAQGEIDIIARRKNLLIIIEVKSRDNLEEAERSLYPSALNRIEDACEIYIARNCFAQKLGVRYDAIFVLKNLKIVHRKNAWRPD
ncbi:MAG: YraN family protein [Robiginitomaculum sp.]